MTNHQKVEAGNNASNETMRELSLIETATVSGGGGSVSGSVSGGKGQPLKATVTVTWSW